MLLTDDFLKNWESIVNDVDKHSVPLNCVKKVIFRDVDRKQKTINLKKLRAHTMDDDEIDKIIQRYIVEHEDSIISMEFVLDVEAVAEQIQPATDKLLQGM